jgi:hypothetical protein
MHRGFLRFMRRLLRPILKLFFNPQPIADALNIQSKLNAQQAALEPLYYEVIHNLVVETTRLGIEVKNLKMRVEAMSSRLDFDERRERALEGVVQYRPGAVAPLQPPSSAGRETDQAAQERRTRRRRRRGRRPGGPREGNERMQGGADQRPENGGETDAPKPSPSAEGSGDSGPVAPKPQMERGGEGG